MRFLTYILLALFSVSSAMSQTARLQVIHNSPDDAATVVDVYLDDALLLDDFAYRTATPFIDAPAGVEITVSVAPGNSTSVADEIASFPFTLVEGETYILVADGITGLSTTVYSPAPAFNLEVFAMGREAAMTSGNTDVLVHHGSTDAPTVDVAEVGVGAGIIVDGASYPAFAGYLELANANYQLAVQTDDNSVTVATYEAPLADLGLENAAITVIASGFLDPSMNGNGPAFGLFVAGSTGGPLVALPLVLENDDPCDALMLATDGTVMTFDNTNATVADGEATIAPPQTGCAMQDGWCANENGIDNSVWFSFEAIDDEVTINTCLDENNIDTQIALFSATDCTDFSTFSLLGANDDAPEGCVGTGNSIYASTLEFSDLTVGQTYWILVDSYDGQLGVGAISVTQSTALSARLQVIHNSPDDAATEVDVYLDGSLLLDDFAFRTATPFIDAPAGVEISVAVAPSTSTSVADAIATFPFILADGETYILVADGITGLSGTTYTPSPSFNLEAFAMGREAAMTSGNTDVLVHHGSTDAPTVDIAEVGVGAGIIVDDASYTDFAGYLELATANYALAVQTADNSATVATYAAPLAGLGLDDAAISVLASGFLDPSLNGDGPAFGLWVALAEGGDLIPLPLALENDGPCDAIDLPVDGSVAVFSNIGATVTSGESDIAPGGGTAANSCQSQDGWCNADSLLQNSVWFSFVATSEAVQVTTCNEGNAIDTQLALYSATDCTDYSTLSLLAANDDLTTPGCTEGTSTFASVIDYCGLTVGQTYWVLVDSYNGAQGDFAISVSESTCPTARLQVIHNSPDDAATEVDVYLNGVLLLDDFAFRTATPFIDAPAGVEVSVAVAPATSTSVDDQIATFPFTLAADETYILVADGITGLSSTVYTPAPAFTLEAYAPSREAATDVMNTDVLVHHGSTDAPTVDVVEVGAGAGIVVDDASYTDFAGYLELATSDEYILEVQTSDNSATVASYSAPLSTLGLDGAAITVCASGFLDPSVNGDGPAFGLWVALATGGELVPLPLFTSLDENSLVEFGMFPNPAQETLWIESNEDLESISIIDMQGRNVLSQAGVFRQMDISGLSQGIYQVAVSKGNAVSFQKLIKE